MFTGDGGVHLRRFEVMPLRTRVNKSKPTQKAILAEIQKFFIRLLNQSKSWIRTKQGKIWVVLFWITLALLVFTVAQQFFEFWKLVRAEEKAKVWIEVVKTVATIVGGIAVFWNVRLTQERLITERFSKAVEQLGDDKLEVRLGGIYALERIARDSPKDHWTIMEVLTSFIQEKSPLQQNKDNQGEEPKTHEKLIIIGWHNSNYQEKKPKKITRITTDVHAALTVIGRRDPSKDPQDKKIDLSYTSLNTANLSDANLRGADLSWAELNYAQLYRADLRGADFNWADLRGAKFNNAKLRGTRLIGAKLSSANLEGVELNRNPSLWS